jgi:hypothetical protein
MAFTAIFEFKEFLKFDIRQVRRTFQGSGQKAELCGNVDGQGFDP